MPIEKKLLLRFSLCCCCCCTRSRRCSTPQQRTYRQLCLSTAHPQGQSAVQWYFCSLRFIGRSSNGTKRRNEIKKFNLFSRHQSTAAAIWFSFNSLRSNWPVHGCGEFLISFIVIDAEFIPNRLAIIKFIPSIRDPTQRSCVHEKQNKYARETWRIHAARTAHSQSGCQPGSNC